MKHYLIHFSLLVLTSFMKLSGQETFENRAKQIALQIETIAQEEKEKLKEQVEKINQDFLKGTLSKEEADQNKLKLAQETAHTIEKRTVIEENKLTALVREKVEGRIQILDTLQKKKKIGIHWNKKKMDSIGYSERRHTTQFVFVAGVNNLVTNNSINGSDFRYWGSHFYEWGFSMNSRILKTNNLLHFKHGISFQYNNLRPTNNRFFVEEGDQTTLRAFPKPINDSRFKVVNLVFPMYLELDFSKSPMINGKKYFHTHKSFRLGVGGFLGFNLKTKQYIEYNENNHSYVLEEKGNFNVNKFVYGLGAYFGYKEISLYLKYDLNPLFKDNSISQNNTSLGIRFDFN